MSIEHRRDADAASGADEEVRERFNTDVCLACGKPTSAGEDFGGPCCEDSDVACAIRQREDATALALELANALHLAHGATHPLHLAEPVESCDVCRLLERARRWAR